MNHIKIKAVLELEYHNYGGHTLAEFEDIINAGVTHLIDEGMISGILEAILEDHTLTVEEISNE
jgi:NurA-like 5'-3' nuclease